ncbi:OfxX fusion product [Pseudomonas aeruginosa]|nr:OfxX fusion product [Pseudomonas aeruginosa]
MRIKIKGEITAERLAEALHAAAEKYEAVRPGHKVYGANLYLTAFDADGLPFDLVDHRGEPLSITIEAKSGELVKPALTAEGEARRQKAKEEARRQAEEAEAEAQRRHRQTLDEYEQERQKRRKKEAEARKQFEDANAITAELLKTMPERFIDELNKTVQGVWDDLKPTETQGKKKGQPKALPVFFRPCGRPVALRRDMEEPTPGAQSALHTSARKNSPILDARSVVRSHVWDANKDSSVQIKSHSLK